MFTKSIGKQKIDFLLDLIQNTAEQPSFVQLFPDSRITKAGTSKPVGKGSPDPETEYEESLEILQQAVYQRGKKKEKKLRWARLPSPNQSSAEIAASLTEIPTQNSIKWNNVGFLPSVPPGKRLLGSDVYNASALEVFYFLRCLVEWTHDTQPTETLVVDCHGAHDLFVVGAIHAATDLVVVTTPDPGSFDGTYDLLAYANHVITSRKLFQPSTLLLVINQVRPSQDQGVKSLVEFFTNNSEKLGGQPFNIETVPGHVDIAAASANYQFGQVAKSRLWPTIVSLGSKIEDRPDYAPEPAEADLGQPTKGNEEPTDDKSREISPAEEADSTNDT
jgi:hypothetical protein